MKTHFRLEKESKQGSLVYWTRCGLEISKNNGSSNQRITNLLTTCKNDEVTCERCNKGVRTEPRMTCIHCNKELSKDDLVFCKGCVKNK